MKEQFMTIGEERESRANKKGIVSRTKEWFSRKKYLKNAFAGKVDAIRKAAATLGIIAIAGQFTIGALNIGAAAGDPANLRGSLAVANSNTGSGYKEDSVNALVDEIVQFELAIHNTEPPESGTVAQNVTAKITLPTNTGTVLTATGTAQGTNTNIISDIASVRTQAPASLKFLPGTARWRYNDGTNENPHWVTKTISDSIVTTGVNLGTVKPCFNMQQNVAIQARVMGSSLKVEKSVAKPGSAWVNENSADPGDTLSYLITFTNTGNTQLTNMVVGDNLPPHMSYVSGSTTLTNTRYPDGIALPDGVVTGGVRVGDYNPGSNGHIKFKVEVDDEEELECGNHRFQNIGIAKADQTLEVWDSAYTNVNLQVCPTAPEFELSKSAFNITQNRDAEVASAHAGDVIRYSLNTRNVGDAAGAYTVSDNISDILQYADVTDANGGTVSGGNISFGSVNIGINQTVTRTFDVRVRQVANWPANGDLCLLNTYGNDVQVCLAFTNIVLAKSAFNNTQSVNATTTTARAGDVITYTLVTRNTGNEAFADYIVQDDLSDILDYATVTDTRGGTMVGNTIRWAAQDIPAGGQLTNTFVIQVKNPIPNNPQNGTHFDFVMQNVYGNEVRIPVERPVVLGGVIAGAQVERLAAAGAGNILIVGLMLVMLNSSLFLYIREKYLLSQAMKNIL